MPETLKTLLQKGTNLANQTGRFGEHEGETREKYLEENRAGFIFPVAILSMLLARETVSYQLNKQLACNNIPAVAALVEKDSRQIDIFLKVGGGINGLNGSYGPVIWPVILTFDTIHKAIALQAIKTNSALP